MPFSEEARPCLSSFARSTVASDRKARPARQHYQDLSDVSSIAPTDTTQPSATRIFTTYTTDFHRCIPGNGLSAIAMIMGPKRRWIWLPAHSRNPLRTATTPTAIIPTATRSRTVPTTTTPADARQARAVRVACIPDVALQAGLCGRVEERQGPLYHPGMTSLAHPPTPQQAPGFSHIRRQLVRTAACRTDVRTPRITGFPTRIRGSAVIRSVAVNAHHHCPLPEQNTSAPGSRSPVHAPTGTSRRDQPAASRSTLADRPKYGCERVICHTPQDPGTTWPKMGGRARLEDRGVPVWRTSQRPSWARYSGPAWSGRAGDCEHCGARLPRCSLKPCGASASMGFLSRKWLWRARCPPWL